MATALDRAGLMAAIFAGDAVARRALMDHAAECGSAPDFGSPKPPRLPELAGYDWDEAFKYGTPELTRPGAPPTDRLSFDADSVAWLLARSEGENDGADWLAVGQLWDGRAFGLKAWCDYTGWD